MKKHAILTALGPDRVGIVDDLTALILEGCRPGRRGWGCRPP